MDSNYDDSPAPTSQQNESPMQLVIRDEAEDNFKDLYGFHGNKDDSDSEKDDKFNQDKTTTKDQDPNL